MSVIYWLSHHLYNVCHRRAQEVTNYNTREQREHGTEHWQASDEILASGFGKKSNLRRALVVRYPFASGRSI